MRVLPTTLVLLSLFSFPTLAKDYTKSSVNKNKKTSIKNKRKKSRRTRKVRINRRTRKAKKNKQSKGFLTSTMGYVDYTQGLISSTWVGFNHDFDMFFSGQRYAKGENKSKLLFKYSVGKSESGELTKAFDFGIKIDLPKLSKKLSIVIEKQRDEILEAQTGEASQGVLSPDNGYTAGVKFQLNKTPFFTSSLNTGVRLILPLDPFVKLKLFKMAEFKFLNIYFGQKLIYYRQEANLRSITELNFSKRLSKNFSLSFGNSLTWMDVTDIFQVRNTISIGQRINDKSSVSYSFGANALLDPTFYYTGYDSSISYRRRIYKDWLSGQLSTGANFLKSSGYEPSLFVNGNVHILMR